MKYKASIIIRTFNEEDWIAHCLLAIKKQKLKDYEIIIIDNHSTDNTIKIAKTFNVNKILKIKKFIPGKALNMGSKGDHLKFVNFDASFCSFQKLVKPKHKPLSKGT